MKFRVEIEVDDAVCEAEVSWATEAGGFGQVLVTHPRLDGLMTQLRWRIEEVLTQEGINPNP